MVAFHTPPAVAVAAALVLVLVLSLAPVRVGSASGAEGRRHNRMPDGSRTRPRRSELDDHTNLGDFNGTAGARGRRLGKKGVIPLKQFAFSEEAREADAKLNRERVVAAKASRETSKVANGVSPTLTLEEMARGLPDVDTSGRTHLFVFVGGQHYSGTTLVEKLISSEPMASGLRPDLVHNVPNRLEGCQKTLGTDQCVAPELEGVFLTRVFSKLPDRVPCPNLPSVGNFGRCPSTHLTGSKPAGVNFADVRKVRVWAGPARNLLCATRSLSRRAPPHASLLTPAGPGLVARLG